MRRRDALAAVILLGMSPICAWAQRLPVSSYGIEDGLPSAYVQHILQDSRRFLWFATRDGLARFDGDRFVTYSVEDGIPDPTVNYVLESRSGQLWVATNGGGVCLFDPTAPRRARMAAFPIGGDAASNRVNVLLEDRRGRIWAGTDNGIWRFDRRSSGPQTFTRLRSLPKGQLGFSSFAETPAGEMWAASSHGLFKIGPDDSLSHLTIRPDAGLDQVATVLLDRAGQLWVGHRYGVIMIDGAHRRWITKENGEPGNAVITIRQGPDGRIWVLTNRALTEFGESGSKAYSKDAFGVPDDLSTLLVDRDELWLGTVSSGIVRVNWAGFTTWAADEKVALTRVHALHQERGAVVAVNGDWEISRFDGRRFHADRRLEVPIGSVYTWRSEVAHFDAETGWWALTNDGLWAFGGGRTQSPRRAPRHYGARDGLVGHPAVMYRDSRGRLWVGTRGPVASGLCWWESQTDRFVSVTPADGLPAMSAASAFAEDQRGQLWIGTYESGLARSSNGRFRMFTPADGAPGGMITALLVDRAGRLWIGTNHDGLTRVDAPTAASPKFVTIGRTAGLLSQNVRSLVEDQYGRIYFGTSRGVGRLDPATGRITNFDSAFGLAPGMASAALRDDGGALWFGTPRGVSRMVPTADEAETPMPVLLGGLRIAGMPHPIAEVGQRSISNLVLRPDQRRLEIDVISPGTPVGGGVRYQHRLLGSDPEWSAPSDERTFTFTLSPGTYRFEARAVTRGGLPSETSAAVAFELLAPVWQRWWFISTMIGAVGMIAVALHRYRLRRALDVERVRTRIATDLHDDIGATLSQIAILSEVARTQSDPQAAEVTAPLLKIARLSGEAVDAMSDIVWALNPHRDRQIHLVQRLRRLASDLLRARNIRFHFLHPEADDRVRLGAEVRREVVLIFKEVLNNIVRHANCSEVDIHLSVDGGCVRLAVSDNGTGFDERNTDGQGNGLRNMRHRAEHLGGSLNIDSAPGRGTRIDLRVPAHAER